MANIWSGLVSLPFLPLRIWLLRVRNVKGRSLTGAITVIILIAAEILVAAINIVVDLYAGVD